MSKNNDPTPREAFQLFFPSWLFAWLALILAVAPFLAWKWYYFPRAQRYDGVIIDFPLTQESYQNTYTDGKEPTWQDEDKIATFPKATNLPSEKLGISSERRLLLPPTVDIVSDRNDLLTEEELVEIAIACIPPTEIASP